ncbi:MAG TPA: SWIM zinc finger family protein [Nocardioides sp.]
MSAVTHPRLPPRRSTAGGTWWSKAWARAVEEAAYAQEDLRAGRALARAGAVGAITVAPGSGVSAVSEGDDAHTVTCTLPVLPDADVEILAELVAASSGRIGALLAGDLPHPFVEAVEEAGVELLPYGGELGATCTCDAWMDPCRHALALLTQLGWLVQRDPFVLTALRGLPREELLARLRRGRDDEEVVDDLAVATEAALRAARELADLGATARSGSTPGVSGT